MSDTRRATFLSAHVIRVLAKKLLNEKTGWTKDMNAKIPDPTIRKGSEIGGSSVQVIVLGSTGHRAGPRHLSKLRAPV